MLSGVWGFPIWPPWRGNSDGPVGGGHQRVALQTPASATNAARGTLLPTAETVTVSIAAYALGLRIRAPASMPSRW